MASAPARQNYHAECEAGVNKQINISLYGGYVYQSMAFYFDRDDVALENFYAYFKKLSARKHCLAEKLMTFQNKRGGRILLQKIMKPDKDDWGTGSVAMETALNLENTVNRSYLNLHATAVRHGDANMTDFLEEEFLATEVELIKQLSDHATNLKRVGEGLGEYLFNKETL